MRAPYEVVDRRAEHRGSLDRAVPGRPDAVNRAEHDFYRTPRVAVEALLSVEKFTGAIWEPACGDGAISEILIERGHEVVSTDLVHTGYGQGGIDFLATSTTGSVPNVITNPPFKLALPFAQKSITLVEQKVAFLCRTLWLEGARRKPFFLGADGVALSRVWVFSARINVARYGAEEFRDGKGGMVSYAWFVWDRAHAGKTELGWL